MKWDAILEHCSFDYMKQHATLRSAALFWVGGAQTFIYKGTNGRWREVIDQRKGMSR